MCQAKYIVKELHEGICGYYSGASPMVARVLRASYKWLTLEVNYAKYVKKCIPFQKKW